MLPGKTKEATLKGLRVQMTMQAILAGLPGKRNRRTGVIVGRQRTDYRIRVRRDGEKSARTYGLECWMPAGLEPAAAPLKPVATRPLARERSNRLRAKSERPANSPVGFLDRSDAACRSFEAGSRGVESIASRTHQDVA